MVELDEVIHLPQQLETEDGELLVSHEVSERSAGGWGGLEGASELLRAAAAALFAWTFVRVFRRSACSPVACFERG